MNTRSLTLIVGGLLAAPAASEAQDPAEGTWPGTLTIGGATIDVTFTVDGGGESATATMRTADGPESPVTDLRIEGSDIDFTWGVFRCTMSKERGSYLGICSATDGTEGRLALTPPGPSESSDDRGDSDVLTGEQLGETGGSDLYDALKRLRPRWIAPLRGGGVATSVGGVAITTTEVQVFLGRQGLGGVDVLRSYDISNIGEVRYYGPRDAMVRFGSRNQGGVIEITLRR